MPRVVWAKPDADVDERLQALLDDYGHVLKRSIRRFAGGATGLDLDEVEQEARLRVWRALSRKRVLRRPESYLYRVAVTAALDALRRLRARREEPLAAVDEGSAYAPTRRVARSPEDAALTGERIAEVRSAMAELSTNRRRAVALHLQGFTTAEIGRLRGWTEAKARNLVYRGLGDLRAKLANEETAVDLE